MGEFQVKKQPKQYDVVIVGSGAGGGMAAKLEAAIHAVQSNVPSVRIGGLDAIADVHSGTMITPVQVPA